jgi:hypothetical protein
LEDYIAPIGEPLDTRKWPQTARVATYENKSQADKRGGNTKLTDHFR